MFIDIEKAHRCTFEALLRVGVSERNAEIQTDLLMEAELRGRPSHGLLRLARIVERIENHVADPHTTGHHDWKGKAFLCVDGQNGLGPVVAMAALDALCERVRDTGVAVASIANNNHLGMLAWYAEKIAARGFTLIALSTSEALVHPWGGRRAMLGTNPIAIGVPALPRPFVLDMATSLVSMGQIHDFAHRKKQFPRIGRWMQTVPPPQMQRPHGADQSPRLEKRRVMHWDLHSRCLLQA